MTDKKLLKADQENDVLDLTACIENKVSGTGNYAQICKMKIRNLDKPKEFLSAGFKFESCFIIFF